MLATTTPPFGKYNRSSIKGDENRRFLEYNDTTFLKYNRSSIKGDENPASAAADVSVRRKYNRSSIKGDENDGIPDISTTKNA